MFRKLSKVAEDNIERVDEIKNVTHQILYEILIILIKMKLNNFRVITEFASGPIIILLNFELNHDVPPLSLALPHAQ